MAASTETVTPVSFDYIKDLRKSDPSLASRLLKKLKKKHSKETRSQGDAASSSVGLLGNMREDVLSFYEKTADSDKVKDEDEDVKVKQEDGEDTMFAEIEYLKEDLTEVMGSKFSKYFAKVIERFQPDDGDGDEDEQALKEKSEDVKYNLRRHDEVHSDDEEDEADETTVQLSKKMLKLKNRPTISQLKEIAKRPDMLDIWDTTALDPCFLVYLKGLRSTVPVPMHWNQKRKYMQGKRGIEKPPFKLPEYIEATKIMEIRQALQEKDANKSLKQKQREKARPKSHRMDIDYQVLHDAFFKYATKPKLTGFGDLYYEGKENETKMKQFKPGKLSETLKKALGMTEGGPSPWLINMQRYGPPLNYPGLKIPGVNYPIPQGAAYGYHAGGWGKPPVSEFGVPLYGDLRDDGNLGEPQYDETFWGKLASDSEEENDDLSDTEEDTKPKGQSEGMRTPASDATGLETPILEGISSVSGLSVTSGLETPASLDIRSGFSYSTGSTPKPYTVLKRQEAAPQPGAFFSSQVTYKMPMVPGSASTGGLVTPLGGSATPGGIVTPGSGFGGAVTPFLGGTVSQAPPSSGLNDMEGGMITPGGGIATPSMHTSGGFKTPGASGVTVNLNPSEMEQEGVFAADVIRQQLRYHEEAASKARRAAGQLEPEEAKKRKSDGGKSTQGDESTGATPTTLIKKKKKKDFKF